MLRSKGEWTSELLEQYFKEIETIAKEDFGLDNYPNQVEIISSQQMIDAYSTHAMPVMYSHWSFGKEYLKVKDAYDKGLQSLAFEVVVNTSPCIVYIMDENSICLQALVYAHAGIGHNYFYKNNYLFKEWTEADFIVDYLIFAKNFIKACEEKHGEEEVELFLNACHSLQLYGVDKYKRGNRKKSEQSEFRRFLDNALFNEKNFDIVLNQTIPKHILEKQKKEEKFNENLEPEENILYFLEKNAPNLQQWQREVIRIVRKVAQYFYPQRMSRVANEGTATFWHYNIMQRMYEKKLVDEGFMLEFLDSHTAVINQLAFDHPYYPMVGINVYALGFAIFQDIKRICMEPTAEDREWFPDFAGNNDWLNTVKWAMKNFRDDSLILQFLSPHLIRKFKMFSIVDEVNNNEIYIDHIHDRQGYQNIRKTLSESYDLNALLPNIQVYDVNDKDRTLYLRHFSDKQTKLLEDHALEVLEHVKYIWGFEVVLESTDSTGEVYATLGTDVNNDEDG